MLSLIFVVFFSLLAECQKLKHGVPRGDKKRKKEVMEQIAQLEVELDARHKQELQDLEAGKDPEVNWLNISYTHR